MYIYFLHPTLSLPTDLWVPVTQKIRPMRACQFSIGGYYTGIQGWEFSVEGYSKITKNVLEYKDGNTLVGNSIHWEEKVEMGKGRSFGVEFMAQKTAGLLTGWINYTLSKSDRQFSTDGINNGKRFPYQYDRRHTLNLTLNYQLTRRIDFNMSWTYASGCMATLPTEKTHTELPPTNVPPSWIMDNLNKGDMDHSSSRNNYRLPASHQLNIGFNFHKQDPARRTDMEYQYPKCLQCHEPQLCLYQQGSTNRKAYIEKNDNLAMYSFIFIHL